MTNPGFILILEDDPGLIAIWEIVLRDINEGIEIKSFHRFEDADEFLTQSSAKRCSGIISDFYLNGSSSGLDFFDRHGTENQNFLLASAMGEEEMRRLQPTRIVWPRFVSKMNGLDGLFSAAQMAFGAQFFPC